MALNIRNPETERLAEALVKLTGETKTEAVTRALRDRLARLRRERAGRRLADERRGWWPGLAAKRSDSCAGTSRWTVANPAEPERVR